MKIGILSMQRVPNYGSFLQAYGLKTILENLGHEVVFIDYKECPPITSYSRKARYKYLILSVPPIRFFNDWMKFKVLGRRLFDYQYRLYYLKQLGIGYRKNIEDVDIAIIGSDEVFNCLQSGFNVGFSPMLFGQGLHASKIITYAASFGYTDLQGLQHYGIQNKVADYLRSLDRISVRDENSRKIVELLTSQKPEVNLDPVLISKFPVPSIDIPFHNYVVLYTYKSREYNEEEKKTILDFCNKNHKTLISIGSVQDWVENSVEATPLELLAYIQAADFIITDTFHGSVFSIKYNRPFATMIRENNRQKLLDLLCRLKREDRIIVSFSDLQDIYERALDYTQTNTIIEKEKEKTLTYLKENLV